MQLQEEEKVELFILVQKLGLRHTNPHHCFKLIEALAKFHLFTHFQGKQNQEYCDHITFVLIWKQREARLHCYGKKQWDSSSDHKNHIESTVLLHVVMVSTAYIQSEYDTVLEDLIF